MHERKIFSHTILAFLRTRILAAVLMPALIGTAFSARQGYFELIRFVLILAGLVIAELMNLFGTDYFSGSPFKGPPGSRPPRLPGNPVLPPSILKTENIPRVILSLGIAGLAILVSLTILAGPVVLIFMALALATGFLYVFDPFPYSFLATAVLPPIICAGVYFVLSGKLILEAFLVGLPVAWISVSVILGYRVLYRGTNTGTLSFDRKKIAAVLLVYFLCPVNITLSHIMGLYPPLTLVAVPACLLFIYGTYRILREKTSDFIPATSVGVLMHSTVSMLVAGSLLL